MVTFIQTTNRNSFSLRFRKYKNLRYDLWGRKAFALKKKLKKIKYQKIFFFLFFLLISIILINDVTSYDMAMFSFVKNVTTKTTGSLTVSIPKKSMSSLHVGRFKHVAPTKTDNGNPVESEVTGHPVVVASICKKTGCGITNCADDKKKTANPCKIPPKNHKDTNTKPKKIQYVLVGNKTHKIPKGKSGILLNSKRDANGPHPNGQSMVIEKEQTTIDTNQTPFTENLKQTQFLQENNHTAIALRNLPKDIDIK